ncbi:MAG: hypothetical protein MUF54_20410 [Polyangiaceae bacterium]|nr:hypothetical protein [Polyangiaceae bacterium]
MAVPSLTPRIFCAFERVGVSMVDKPFGGRTATFVLAAACLTTGLVGALPALGAGSVFL